MTRPRPVLAIALLIPLFAACEQGPTAPSEEAAQIVAPSSLRNGVSQRFDISGTLLNRCTGESIQVTGQMTRVAKLHEDQGGGYHWFQNYSIHATAVGLTTGNEYIYNEIHNMKENGDLPFDALFDDTGAYYFTMSFISTWISKGAEPNMILQWDIRYKMDRDGNITMQELRREFVCRG